MGKKKDRLKKGQLKLLPLKNHVFEVFPFKNRAQEHVYENLVIQYLVRHLPKVEDFVSPEVRANRPVRKQTSVLSPYITSFEQKSKCVETAKLVIRYLVVTKKDEGFKLFGDLKKDYVTDMFLFLKDKVENGEMTTKEYEDFLYGTIKFFQALAAKPDDRTTPYTKEKRLSGPLLSIIEQGLLKRKYIFYLKDLIK